jgi:UDPglucose--hexose-1-phosphate uridylyltransferase
MARYVPDVVTKRWVVITPSRLTRPEDNKSKLQANNADRPSCAFCEGNEELTPPEVWRFGGEGFWNKPGWKVRVVPNKYAITDTHEVIIHSPEHAKDIEDLSVQQVQLVLQVYRQRFQTHRENGQVLIFCNHGYLAGASLSHPHSQLVVLPKQITFDSLSREPLNNLVKDNKYFTVYCPDFSQWPYEVWIAPKQNPKDQGSFKTTAFSDTTNDELNDLAVLLQETIKKLRIVSASPKIKKLSKDGEFAYNYYIYHGNEWYLRIIPRFINRAGFELGTGLSVNIVDPGIVAEELRGIDLRES